MLSMSFSGTLRWQPSTASLGPTLYSNCSMKCRTRCALTVGNRPQCGSIGWPIPTTFTMMIRQVSFTTILLNALWCSCNHLCSGNICHMVQRRNSMMMRNVSTPRWNQATGSGMNWHVSSFLSWLQFLCPLQYLQRPLGAIIVPVFGRSD